MTDKQLVNAVRRARQRLHRASGYDPAGGHYKAVDTALDQIESELLQRLTPRWAHIGPVTKGGKSLLDMSLTHRTSGIPLFPAVDTAWGAGVAMIAPESCKVDTKDTSASPGEALYLTGWSLMRYWFAHIDRDYPLGHTFAKGELIGKTVNTSRGGGPHGHVGVNAEAFLGRGKQLKYGKNGNGPDYTLGAPTIRQQLEQLEL